MFNFQILQSYNVIRQLSFFILLSLMTFTATYAQPSRKPVRVIMIGAHPDDCDIKGGGTAALFASMGYAVKFLSVTNGDAGHQLEGGAALARRRAAEADESGKRLGVTYEVLNNHDGELVPDLAVRLQIIRKIREWNADIVIAPRPNDYHPDHRYTGILVQDASYMVGVPNIAPDVAPLKKNPVFLYFRDAFTKPNPFHADIAVDITAVYDKKIAAMDAHQSQFYEWLPWIGGYADQVPKGADERKKWLGLRSALPVTPEVRAVLEKFYGKRTASLAKHAEVFEICEYGSRPSEEEIRELFPMLKK
jgi:LmbE family N-acetylglucosaminyl deacetylase